MAHGTITGLVVRLHASTTGAEQRVELADTMTRAGTHQRNIEVERVVAVSKHQACAEHQPGCSLHTLGQGFAGGMQHLGADVSANGRAC